MESLNNYLIKMITITLIGLLLFINYSIGNPFYQGIILIFEFMIVRAMRNAMHYDNMISCTFMTVFTMTILFCLAKTDFITAIILTCFTAYTLSMGKIKIPSIKRIIQEGFMFKPKGQTKYDDMDEWIKRNPNSEKLKLFEEKLKKFRDKRLYLIYTIRFRQKTQSGEIPSLTYMEEETQIDKRRIVECLDKIQCCFEMFCEQDKEIEEQEDKLIKK